MLIERAPAKLNLTLDVVGRRADGYHEIRTVMQAVDLCDEVALSRTDGGGIRLSLSDPSLPADGSNSCHKAATCFLEATRLPCPGVSIHVTKRIPQQAGLAGGSADAAAVLRGLNRLFGAGLSARALCEIGARVGADVPFCIEGGAALATGIGEQLAPLPPLRDVWIVIAKPPVGVSTQAAYAAIDTTAMPLTRPAETRMIEALGKGDPALAGSLLCNVFEQVLSLPAVSEIRREMAAFSPLGSAMTGSGSAVFSLFASEIAAQNCATALAARRQTFVCCPLPRSPLS